MIIGYLIVNLNFIFLLQLISDWSLFYVLFLDYIITLFNTDYSIHYYFTTVMFFRIYFNSKNSLNCDIFVGIKL